MNVSTTRVEWDVSLCDTLCLHYALAKPFNCVVQTSRKEGRSRPGNLRGGDLFRTGVI